MAELSHVTCTSVDEHSQLANRMRQKITVLGSGDFGCALTKRLSLAGFDVVMGSRNPQKRRESAHLAAYRIASLEEASEHSDVIFLAIPCKGYDEMMSSLDGKLSGTCFTQYKKHLIKNLRPECFAGMTM